MSIGLIGRKCGMTRVFCEDGSSVPVTVLQIDSNRVTQVKSVDVDGYRSIQVAAGDTVEKGQTLMLLEAMKMEIRIKSPAGGQVKRLLVANGQAVDKDQMLVEIGD